MKITHIFDKVVPINSNIQNAYIRFTDMTASIVAVVTDVRRDGKQVIGYGFNSNGRYAASGLLRERFIPRILNAVPASLLNTNGSNFDPHAVWDIMMQNEKPGGHGERSVAVGILDMAIWDLVSKIEGIPLYHLLASRYGAGRQADKKVFVYAAGGYYHPNKNISVLQDEIRSYLDMGYTVVKIKIGALPLQEDLKRIDAVLKIVGDGQRLAVDANGRFDLRKALDYADKLADYNLRWYEEAGDPLDYQLQATLAEYYAPALATGENLFSVQDARNLIRYGGMRSDRDILQFDCALSYGLVEYLRILDMLEDHGWSSRQCIPHGGHQMSLNIAAGLHLGGNESYPDVFQPFGGFADRMPIEDSYISLPDAAGIGFETKDSLYKLLTTLTNTHL